MYCQRPEENPVRVSLGEPKKLTSQIESGVAANMRSVPVPPRHTISVSIGSKMAGRPAQGEQPARSSTQPVRGIQLSNIGARLGSILASGEMASHPSVGAGTTLVTTSGAGNGTFCMFLVFLTTHFFGISGTTGAGGFAIWFDRSRLRVMALDC